MNIKQRMPNKSSQSGQALVEFTIAAATVLVPLFLMIPILGKYMDMKATAIQAARYAAWERTVWFGHAADSSTWGSTAWPSGQKTDAEIQNELRQRFFSDTATAKLQSSQSSMTGWGGSGPKPLWRDRAGNPMLADYNSNVTEGSPRTDTPGTLNVVFDPLIAVINTIDKILGSEFKVDMQSLYTATVNVQTVQTMPIRQVISNESISTGTPLFTMTNVLVANGWNANGADFVKQQVEGLTPSSIAKRQPLDVVLQIAQWVFTVVAPELNPTHLILGGKIQPDIVPCDRLKDGC